MNGILQEYLTLHPQIFIMNKGIYYAIFTAFLWGFLAIGLKVAVAIVPPVTVTWFRFTLAFFCMLVFYLVRDREKLRILKRPPWQALLAGVFLGCNYVGFISGVQMTTPTIAQVFAQVGPAVLALSSIFLFKEKMNTRQILGLVVVIVGMLVFYQDKMATVTLHGDLHLFKIGVVVLIFGALTWVLYAVFQKKVVNDYDALQLNLLIFGVPMLLITPFAEFNVFSGLTFGQWLLMAYLGLNTLIAYGSLALAFKYTEANKVSVIVTLNPLITFGGMLYLSYYQVSWISPETFSVLTIVGAVMALLGVVLTVFKRKN